ncbi:MAG: chloride channel protein [Acidimicrobiales bacterium]
MSPPSPPTPRANLGVGHWLLRRALLGGASGFLAGLACWALLTAIDRVTALRLDHGWLLGLLPVVGLAVGLANHHLGGRSSEGTALLLEQIHEPSAWVPRRMAPLVAIGTVTSHLVGASVGREGTALAMSGSLTDAMARALGLAHHERRALLVAALAGGFGAVFGVPWAGAIFALEVQSVRRGGRLSLTRLVGSRRHRATARFSATAAADRPAPGAVPLRRLGRAATAAAGLVVPVLAASFIGNEVVERLGYHHTGRPRLQPVLDVALLVRVGLVAVALGLTALAFVEATDLVRLVAARVRWPPARPLLGGVAVLGLVALVGRDELGLSLPLVDAALAGHHTSWTVPALKIMLTVICLGTGFVGGEVTPLFVIGGTLGSALGPAVGLDPVVGGAVGFVAVFGGATNTPLACTVMGVELFGPGLTVPLAVACVGAYWCSGGRGLYATQRMATAEGHERIHDRPALVARLGRRHRPGR